MRTIETAVRASRRGVLAAGAALSASAVARFAWAQSAPDQPAFIDLNANAVQWTRRAALGRLPARWRDRSQPLVIAHFGDSHVQKGIAVDVVRQALQAARGDGGWGMTFPYAMAHTYSQSGLDTAFTGLWRTANSIQQPPKMPLGVSGFTAVTSDAQAEFTVTLRRPLPPGPRRLRLFHRVIGAPCTVTVTSGAASRTVDLQSPDAAASAPHVDIDLPNGGEAVSVRIVRAPDAAGAFELRGLSLERPGSGLVLHNLGVGGAVFNAFNQLTWFEPEIAILDPDLLILDYGTNDVIFTNTVAPEMETVIRGAVRRARAACPAAAVLITPPQDAVYRARDITAALSLAALCRRIAFEEACLFWDWHRIAGGVGAMERWHGLGLSRDDHIHLSGDGYRLKGRLLAEALLQTIDLAARAPDLDHWRVADPGGDPIDALLSGPGAV